ncbi:ATP-binding protein [Ramlibacter sp. Leaf400]|uniref:ATP-binding protein n=1 Tax=Ramlibacter sp. Leaf400 TaxID=1736365 RepID=UPI0006F3C668|nr:histidine kinase dimerization/phospho-acceptor domain-containing protein [Ramlibacter sp. Leaf400]KQT11191.1 hypothetical protein ASG30_04720 [Ramlibacter sp. Leaf400]
MRNAILSTVLAEADFTTVRSLTRQVSELVGLDSLKQTRLATAVSEISRNAVDHGKGGTVEFLIESAPHLPYARCLTVEVRDSGPGIDDLEAALTGYRSASGKLPMGIVSSKRLVDHLSIERPPEGGTLVRLSMNLPAGVGPVTAHDAQRLARTIQPLKPFSPYKELEHQNRELLRVHQELKDQQFELERADERKNQFVKTLAHELRNPLSTLELTLTLLRRKPDIGQEELFKRLDVMGRQTAQLSRLVSELMDVARVSEGKVELHRQPAELNLLTADAAEMASGAVAAKSHA